MAFKVPTHGRWVYRLGPSSDSSSLPSTNRSGPPVLATLAEDSMTKLRVGGGWAMSISHVPHLPYKQDAVAFGFEKVRAVPTVNVPSALARAWCEQQMRRRSSSPAWSGTTSRSSRRSWTPLTSRGSGTPSRSTSFPASGISTGNITAAWWRALDWLNHRDCA